jgi:hypothetical protein
VGVAEQRAITVQNTGQAQLVGSAVLASQPGFSIVSGAAYTIDPGANSPTIIGFSSGTPGTFIGTATFMSNGGWINVPIVATVVTHLTAARDFDGDGFAGDVLHCVEQGNIPRPRDAMPSVPRALEAICLKALAKRPEVRYASAKELANAFAYPGAERFGEDRVAEVEADVYGPLGPFANVK